MHPLLPLLITVLTLAVCGCGGNTLVSIGQLAESEQAYTGQHVLTRGVVRHEHDPDGSAYFVLSDPHGALVGLRPSGTASPFEGRFVQVSGLFEFQPGFGRVIDIATIELAPDDGD